MTGRRPAAGLVDVDALRVWMTDHDIGEGELTDLAQLGGGTQNVLLAFRRGGREFVLRRPPLHPRPTSNDAVRREVTTVLALRQTPVPVPAVLATCYDTNVLGGAFFYLMERVRGFNATEGLPPLHADDSAVRYRMGLAAVDSLAQLAEVDYEAVGLGDLGSPGGFLERQVGRWLSELESFGKLSGYTGPDLPGLDRTAAWLENHRPADYRPGILHGDFHLANLMFCLDSPDVTAIVDWEMATVGDPLLDLGWLLATWPDRFDRSSPAGVLGQAGGLPTRAELVTRYQQIRGLEVPSVYWYCTLACFKLGIILEGTYARACAGKAPRELGDRMRQVAQVLFTRAERFMAAELPT